MSVEQDNQRSEIERGIRRDLTEAKIRLNKAIEEWTQAQRLTPQQRELARERLHSAVIGLWWRMSPHCRDGEVWEDLSDSDALERDHIWKGVHPATGEQVQIDGLADVEEWIEKTVTETQQSSSPNAATGAETVTRRVRLPVDAAIEIARVLSIRYEAFGWDVAADEKEQQTKIDDDLLEEVEEWRQQNV